MNLLGCVLMCIFFFLVHVNQILQYVAVFCFDKLQVCLFFLFFFFCLFDTWFLVYCYFETTFIIKMCEYC